MGDERHISKSYCCWLFFFEVHTGRDEQSLQESRDVRFSRTKDLEETLTPVHMTTLMC